VSVSVLTLTVISVERYNAICHPFNFKATARRARTMIFIVWIISLTIILPEFIVLKTFRRFPDDLPTDLLTTCKPAWAYYHQVRRPLVHYNSLHACCYCCVSTLIRLTKTHLSCVSNTIHQISDHNCLQSHPWSNVNLMGLCQCLHR